MADQKTILIIDDDREIAEVVGINLRDLDISTKHAADGIVGLKTALETNPSLVILDIMLPGMNGLEVLKKIKEQKPYLPVLMLTAKSSEVDRVVGLEIGADDYLVKPFGMRELIARVKALLRRTYAEKDSRENPSEQAPISFPPFFIDFSKRKVTLDGKHLELTVKEFELLVLFIRNPGRTYDRSELLRLVWGYAYEGYEHTVNSHINRLRAKIEPNPTHPVYLETVWGIGYRFTEGGKTR